MRRRFILIAVAVSNVLAVTVVATLIILSARSGPPIPLTQTTWTLTTLEVDGQEQALSSSRSATLQFGAHDGQISGSAGCNVISGTYSLNGTRLQFSALRTTLIACLDPVVGRLDPVVSMQESLYFHALSRVVAYRLKGNTLTLSGEHGEVQLFFRAS